MGAKFGPAMENLAHHVGAAPASVG
jgi:hypothetical protein